MRMLYGSKENKKGALPPFKIRVPIVNSVDAFVSACIHDAKAHGYRPRNNVVVSLVNGVPIFRVKNVVEQSAGNPIRQYLAPKRELSDIFSHKHEDNIVELDSGLLVEIKDDIVPKLDAKYGKDISDVLAHKRDDNIVELDSSLLEEITEDVVPKVMARHSIPVIDFSREINLDSEFAPKDVFTDIYDVKKASPAKRKKFDEAIELDRYFNSRDELGLSVDYFKDKRGNDQFRYRINRENKKGKWVSASYVREAVSALKEYDSLVKEGSWASLRRARSIAGKYFTGKESAMAYAVIDTKLKKTAMYIVERNKMASLPKDEAMDIYRGFMSGNNVHYMKKMVEFAKKNLSLEEAEDAQRRYSAALHANGPKLSVIRNDSVPVPQYVSNVGKQRPLRVAAMA